MPGRTRSKKAVLVPALLLAYSAAFSIDIKTAYQDVYPKYIIAQENGKAAISGLCVDIENALERADPAIKFVAPRGFVPITRIESGLETGELDAFCGLTKNAEREKKYRFVWELYKTGGRIVARTDEKAAIASLEDIKKLGSDAVVLALYGSAQASYLRSIGLDVDDGGVSINDNFVKLLNGRGRFFYQYDLGVFATINRYGYGDKVKVYPGVFNQVGQYFVLSAKTPKAVLDAVRTAFDKIKISGELDRIIAGYFTVR
jgi:polar amino acid transport system substrate-binding protein